MKSIDPRGPRFGAAITAVLLLTVIGLGLVTAPGGSLAERALQAPFVLFALIAGLFAWGAFAGIQRHPYGVIFRTVIRPRIAAAETLEDPAAPTFAQGVGFAITLIGLVLHLVGVPYALVIAASAAFVAAFLNAVFGYCLGCQIYIGLVRLGLLRSKPAASA